MGSVIPCCELQARWIAGVFAWTIKLPAPSVTSKWMEAYMAIKSDKNPSRLTRDDNHMGMMMDDLAWEVNPYMLGPLPAPQGYRFQDSGSTISLGLGFDLLLLFVAGA